MEGKTGVVVGIIGAMVGVAGFGWGIYTFNAARVDAQQRPVLEKQLEACIDINKAANDVLETKGYGDKIAAKKATESFDAILSGKLKVTGDKKVVIAASDFFACYNAPQCMFLKDYAKNLAIVCRTAVMGSLDATLPPISPPTLTGVKCPPPGCDVRSVTGNMVEVHVK